LGIITSLKCINPSFAKPDWSGYRPVVKACAVLAESGTAVDSSTGIDFSIKCLNEGLGDLPGSFSAYNPSLPSHCLPHPSRWEGIELHSF